MKAVLIVLVLGLGCVVSGNDVCKEVTTASTKLVPPANFPDPFIVDIEAVIKKDKTVQHMTMYYSKYRKIIRLDVTIDTRRSSYYYYFDLNEILTFDFRPKYGRGKCRVITDLSNSVDDFMFGGTDRRTTTPHIPPPSAVLHLMGMSGFADHKIKTLYMGNVTKRGKLAQKFTSCQKWNTIKNGIVLNVTHYFTDAKYNFPDNFDSTLLTMEITGTGTYLGLPNQDIENIYSFFNFRRVKEGDVSFETPEGIACKGRKNVISFPKVPRYIWYSGETIDRTNKTYNNIEEVYDFDQQIAILKYVGKLTSDPDMNRQTLVLDFSSGKMFIVDNVQVNCRGMDINDYPGNLDVFTRKRHKTMMRDPNMFYLGNPEDFSFLGKKTIRGMTTDVWVAPTNTFKGGVVEIHFAPAVSSWNDNNKEYVDKNFPMPLRAKVWINDNDKQGITQNIFHVDYNRPPTDYVDLTPCYKYKYHFQVIVSGKKQDILNSYEELFIQKAKTSIYQTGQIGYLQVMQFQLFYTSDKIFVEFLIGEQDKIKMSAAVARITKGFNSKKLQLMVRPAKSTKWSKALPLVSVSSVDVYAAENAKAVTDTSKDSGYSSGAMAGLAIGMIIVGLLGGTGAGYAHGKYYG